MRSEIRWLPWDIGKIEALYFILYTGPHHQFLRVQGSSGKVPTPYIFPAQSSSAVF